MTGTKRGLLSVLAVLALLMVISPAIQAQNPSANAGTNIDEIEIELENRTGTLHFLFKATGSAPAGTDHVNITFGYENSTDREMLGYWFEPIDLEVLDSALSLKGTGEGEDNWTAWEFRLLIEVPMDGSVRESLEPLLALAGLFIDPAIVERLESIEDLEDIANLTGMEDPEDLLDMEELLRRLSDTGVLMIAHAVDGDENLLSSAEKEFKLKALDALFTFLMEEGIVEDPFADDDEVEDEVKDEEGEGEEGYPAAVLLMVSSGILLLVAAVLLGLFLLSRRRKE